MTHDEMIAVIQAHKEGKQIEFQKFSETKIWTIATTPCWNFHNYNYRVKVEPITRYVYIGVHPLSSQTFHTSECYGDFEKGKQTFLDQSYNTKYNVLNALKINIDPHTNELLSVCIVK